MAYDPYRQLGIENGATDEEIRKAYKSLCQIHHPDKNPGDPYAGTRFKTLKEAYEILMDPDRRARAERGEDTRKFNPRPNALNMVVQVMQEELQKQGHVKLIYHMRDNLRGKKLQNEQALLHGQAQLEGLTTALDKFEFNGNGVDIITEGLREALRKLETTTAELKNSKIVFETALLILGDYEDIADLQLSGATMTTTSTGTTW